MSQEHKKEIQMKLKPILEKYQVKASLGVKHYSTIVLNIYSSPIDFIGNYNKVTSEQHRQNFEPGDHMDVNHFYYKEQFTGKALEFLTEVMTVLNDKQGVEVEDGDYGTVPNYYTDINIGKWDKPYVLLN